MSRYVRAIGERLTGVRQAVGQITSELVVGVRVVLDRPLLRIVFASLGFFFLAQGVINVLLIVVISQLWHTGATEFGWLITAQGVGGIIGTVVVGAVAARVKPRTMIIAGGVVAGTIFTVMVNQPSVYVAIAIMPILGIATVAFSVGLTTLIQLGSDDANRGRVGGLMQTVMAAAELISIGLTSLMADQLGSTILLNVAGALFILGGLVAILAPRILNPAARLRRDAPTRRLAVIASRSCCDALNRRNLLRAALDCHSERSIAVLAMRSRRISPLGKAVLPLPLSKCVTSLGKLLGRRSLDLRPNNLPNLP